MLLYLLYDLFIIMKPWKNPLSWTVCVYKAIKQFSFIHNLFTRKINANPLKWWHNCLLSVFKYTMLGNLLLYFKIYVLQLIDSIKRWFMLLSIHLWNFSSFFLFYCYYIASLMELWELRILGISVIEGHPTEVLAKSKTP